MGFARVAGTGGQGRQSAFNKREMMKLDPISLEILGNKVTAITEQMGYALQRTGRTLYVKETADFGIALADRKGKFFAYPKVIGISGFIDLDCMPAIRAVGALNPGDVVITNHPYDSWGLATHTPDIHFIKPIYHDDQIVCYAWAYLHFSDMGGRVPSSISPSSSELYQEGFLIPPMKLIREGKIDENFLKIFRANCRTPDANVGDVMAILAALGVAERRVAEVIEQHCLTERSSLRDVVSPSCRCPPASIAAPLRSRKAAWAPTWDTEAASSQDRVAAPPA